MIFVIDAGIPIIKISLILLPVTFIWDGEVHYLNAGYAGIFLPTVEHWTNVKKGDKIGEILDPLESVVKEELYSECDGILFTLREYPVVSEGSLIGRILERQA